MIPQIIFIVLYSAKITIELFLTAKDPNRQGFVKMSTSIFATFLYYGIFLWILIAGGFFDCFKS